MSGSAGAIEDCSAEKKRSLRVRYVYGMIFLMYILLAWLVRDYGQKFLPQLHCESKFFHFTNVYNMITQSLMAGALREC